MTYTPKRGWLARWESLTAVTKKAINVCYLGERCFQTFYPTIHLFNFLNKPVI
jgi:hypothetical protein